MLDKIFFFKELLILILMGIQKNQFGSYCFFTNFHTCFNFQNIFLKRITDFQVKLIFTFLKLELGLLEIKLMS
jgi:hypothetical protein